MRLKTLRFFIQFSLVYDLICIAMAPRSGAKILILLSDNGLM